MKAARFRIILSALLAAAVSLAMPAKLSLAAAGSTGLGAAVSANAPIKGKGEVVYALLAPSGGVRSVYVVNHFTLAGAGSITDHGDYTSVINLTDTAPMAHSGDTVTVQTDAENFYYQGNMAGTELPWAFDIAYSLDGVKTEPQGLAGKSGKLEIHIASKSNAAVSPAFYDHYLLQISITLDTEKCGDIKAPGATVAEAGKSKMIAYTVMPGTDADISLSATVRDFTMTGINISAMPFSMSVELPDADRLADDFTELSDAISELNGGVGELADGVEKLETAAGKLTNGSSDIKNGLLELSGNSGQLLQASSQISGALSQISSALNGSSGEVSLGELAKLPQGLSQLADGLHGISGGLIELKNGFSQAYAALDRAMLGIPDVTISQDQIVALYAKTDPSAHGLLDELIASYAAGQTVKGTYSGVKDAFGAVAPTLDTLSASIAAVSAELDGLSKKIGAALSGTDRLGQLAQLFAGLTELNGSYAAFHNGLTGYMDGVSALSLGYSDFHKGISSFKNGVGKLYDGAAELHEGTAKLSDETAKIPDTIRAEIDGMLEPYTGSGFEPVSFTSHKNGHTDLVQFVLKCGGIEKPKEVKAAQAETREETFWDRLISLFAGKKED